MSRLADRRRKTCQWHVLRRGVRGAESRRLDQKKGPSNPVFTGFEGFLLFLPYHVLLQKITGCFEKRGVKNT